MPTATVLILMAALLPPKSLDILGEVVEERTVLTPYGEAGPLALRAMRGGAAAWVQPYTGLPTRTDARATIFAAKQLGVQRILNWDMAIALNPLLPRGDSAIVTDYIAWISHQPDTFFDHMPVDLDWGAESVQPTFCPLLTDCLRRLLPGAPEVVCLATDFLRRETPAEARMFRSFGADVLSYNLAPEVALAREMGLCYAGLVTTGAVGADRQARAAGGMASTLHAVAERLPYFVEQAAALPACSCGCQPLG